MSKKNNINKDNSYNKNQENYNNHYVGFGVGFGLIGGSLFGDCYSNFLKAEKQA